MVNRQTTRAMVCSAILTMAIPARAPAFLLYDSQLLGNGVAYALNESSWVVGYRWDPVIYQGTAVVWEPSKGPRDLQPAQASWAYDINDLGAILVANTDTGRKLILTDSGTLDATGVHGVALNNLLQVVGSGGIWEAGEVRSIDGVEGRDINDRGQVAGFLIGTGGVIWDDGEITVVEKPPELVGSGLTGINELGQVVGVSQNQQRVGGAFYWDGVTSVVLATLAGEDTWAHALNDLSQIVGWSETERGERHAVLWEDGRIADLNELLTEAFDYTLVEAVDINNRRQIACRAVDASGGSWAVLLNPIPEPRMGLLLAAGAAFALRRNRTG